jgi:hypothetical protein
MGAMYQRRCVPPGQATTYQGFRGESGEEVLRHAGVKDSRYHNSFNLDTPTLGCLTVLGGVVFSDNRFSPDVILGV